LFINLPGANELHGHRLWTLLRFGCAGVWSAAFCFLFHSSLLDPILLDGYTCCCGSGAWCLVRYRRARDDQGAMAGWLGGLLVFFGESSMLKTAFERQDL
jgi:hypothetical protein